MSTAAGPDIVESGLVLYLDAGNSRSYPGTGTTWTDLSGGGNHGTLTNGPTYTTVGGGAIAFDGTNDNIQLGNASKFIGASQSAITVSMWVKPNVVGEYRKLIYTGTASSNAINGIYMSLGPNTGAEAIYSTYFGVKTASGNVLATTTTTLLTTSYTHLCGTYDGTNVRLYVNTNNINTAAQTGNIVNTGITRISGYDNNTEVFVGNIAQVSIYNRALSASEIAQNFNATRSRFGL